MPADEMTTGRGQDARATVAGAAGAVSVATTISRIMGVVREMVTAKYFGAGFYTDAFNVAYRVPNLLRDLFAEGALSSAFVPTFIRHMTPEGTERAWLLANLVINGLAVVLGGATLLFFFGARWFVYLLAAGFAAVPEKFDLTVQMTRIMSPFLLFVALAAVFMGMLNACGSFFVPAVAPAAFNACCILSAVLLSGPMERWGMQPIVSMAVGALAGGACQLLVQVPSARAAGFRYRAVLDFRNPGVRHIVGLMLPAVIGLSATQINIMVDSQLASRFGDGPVSWLNYAFRLMQLPIGVFGMAIATATLAEVSRHAARNDMSRLRSTIASSLRLAACLTFPSAVGLIVCRREIVRLLYERGRFLPGDTEQTSRVLLMYALALFAYSAVKIVVPAFYALNDTRTPVRASMITVSVKIAANLMLIVPMGYLGLALSTAVASWLNFGMLLRQLLRRTGGGWRRAEYLVYLRIALASIAMGAVAYGVLHLAQGLFGSSGFWAQAANLALAIGAGIAAIPWLLRLLRVEDVRALTELLVRRFAARP